MALSASNATEPRAFSIGPLKQQNMTFSVASGDTSGTVTADGLSSVTHCVVTGLVLTAAPTFSGNVVTLAFADPLATHYGQITIYGK